MLTANPAKAIVHKTTGLAIAFLVAALVVPKTAWAASGNVQTCQPSGVCHIGEFLYDDSYLPLITTSCTLTSKYPDGTVYLTNQAMTAAADGWYSYEISSTPTTQGVYRTQISCIVGEKTFATTDINTTTEEITVGLNISTDTLITFSSTGTLPTGLVVGTRYYAINVDSTIIKVSATQGGSAINFTNQGTGTHTINSNLMSLDKTFEVRNDNNLSAADVWGYSSRSLTTFGSLISDIWSYSTRSLTTFGTLVADVWTNTTRTLTGAGLNSGTLATTSDVTTARDNIKGASNKDLSQLSTEVAGVKTDTGSIVTTVGLIYTDTQALRTDVTSILNKWGTASAASIIADIDAVSVKLGTNADLETASTIFGRVEYVRNKWGSQTAQTIYDKANSASTTVTSLRAELDYNGKTTTAYQDLQSLLGYVDSLESSVGTQTDAATATTLFGRIKKVQDKVDSLNVVESDLRGILDTWGADNNIPSLYTKIVDIRTKLDTVGTVNITQSTVTNIENVSNQTTITNNVLKEIKNEVITMMALTEVNRTLLEKTVNKPIIQTFLLEGSVIFKSLIVNPSTRISQSIDFEYYLPEELTKEDILDLDPSLTLNYNSDRGQYYVTGTFTLAQSETKTVSVRTEDIWQVSQEEVDTVRKQAEELSKVLNINTSYFAQGVTLKSDIDVSLDKVVEIQKNKVTPEAKIKAYRDAKIEFNAAGQKIEKLKELATTAGSSSNFLGFVGGSQAIAVWGLIIIMAAGFVFLALYMRTLRAHELQQPTLEKADVPAHTEKPGQAVKQHNPFKSFLKLAGLILAAASLSAAVSATIAFKVLQTVSQKDKTEIVKVEPVPQVLGESKEIRLPNKEGQACNFAPEGENKGQKALLVLSGMTKIDVFCLPNSNSQKIITLESPERVEKLGEIGQWAFIGLGQTEVSGALQRGWVKKEQVIVTKVSERDSVSDSGAPRGSGGEIDLSALQNQVTILETPTGYLNVRNEPWGKEEGQVKPGESYPFIEEKNGWIKIQLLDGEVGWVAKKFINSSDKESE